MLVRATTFHQPSYLHTFTHSDRFQGVPCGGGLFSWECCVNVYYLTEGSPSVPQHQHCCILAVRYTSTSSWTALGFYSCFFNCACFPQQHLLCVKSSSTTNIFLPLFVLNKQDLILPLTYFPPSLSTPLSLSPSLSAPPSLPLSL